MISTKDLRDIFDEATKRASDVISDAKIPEVSIGRKNDNSLVVFGAGLLLGAICGMVVAFLVTPYSGEQARQKLNQQVDKVRKQREELGTNGGTAYSSTPGYGSPTSAYERS